MVEEEESLDLLLPLHRHPRQARIEGLVQDQFRPTGDVGTEQGGASDQELLPRHLDGGIDPELLPLLEGPLLGQYDGPLLDQCEGLVLRLCLDLVLSRCVGLVLLRS